jgi:phosphoenolpyruvate synthase/pyruvate phosphate dikinase
LNGMAVVVQTLIEPDYAGVILLRNPSNETELLIEYVEGHAEKIVSRRSKSYKVSRPITSNTMVNNTPVPFRRNKTRS